MDDRLLRQALAALHHAQTPANRADQARRLVQKALEWADQQGGDIDLEMIVALGNLLPVREAVLRSAATKSSVEGFFVAQGWTSPRCREVFRALERLPDRAASIEEKLVADADTILTFGIVGFARQLVLGAARGESLAACAESMLKSPGRRLYTVPAQSEAGRAKPRLRELASELKQQLAIEDLPIY